MAPDEPTLGDAYYPQLLNVARSAGLDLSHSPTKAELVEEMAEAGIARVGWNEWELDGDPIELAPVQTSQGSSEPKDETILYCLSRESTEEHVDRLRDALDDVGYELRQSGENGENYKVVLPATEEEDAEAPDPEAMTRDELYEAARELDIEGRSDMSKEELAAEVADAQNDQ